MKEVFLILGAVLAVFCTLPYIIDIVKGKTRPNIVTWIVWTLLISIGTAALFANHDYNAAWFLVR